MAYELARAYVQIIPSMRGAGAKIQAELNGTDISSRVASSGVKMGGRLASAMKKTMKTTLVAGASATGGLMATALTKGFGRLRAFEQAQKSMEGMGLSAQQISVVMGNANAAVEGTAFGLDAAATAAKSLVTAGVEPGEKLQRVLSLIGDTAAQAGTDFNTMGLIWGKVFAKGKLQGDEAMQLMEAGIPVYQLVAKQLGITADEAMALGQKGQISAEMFADAMESQFKGSALSMGDTVSGSFQNVLAALGRLGQGVLAGPFGDLPALFTTVRDKINAITPAVTAMSTEVYTRVRSIAVALSGGGVRPIEEAFGLDRASANRVATTLARLQAQSTLTGAAFRKAGADIATSFNWVKQGASLEGLMGVFDRLAALGGLVARGFAQIAAAAAPMVSYAAQAATILGGGLLSAAESLVPAGINLAEAIAKTGVSFSSILVPGAQIAASVMVPLANAIAAVADVAATLPTPLLAVGVAFASTKLHLGPLSTVMGGLQKTIDKFDTTRVVSGFESLYLRALYVKDGVMAMGSGVNSAQGVLKSLGTAASGAVPKLKAFGTAMKGVLAANLPLLALSTLVSILTSLSAASQRNKQEIRDLADSFDELGNATDDTRAKIVEMMRADENWAGLGKNLEDRLNDVGISTKKAVDAIIDGGPKLEALQKQLNDMADQQKNMRGEPTRRAGELRDLADAVGKVAGEYSGASDAAKKAALASRDAAAASRDEADSIKKVIEASSKRQDQLLGVANKALAAREAQRGLNSAVEEAAKVIEAEGSSLDQKNAALDRVAQATQRAVVTARDNKASQEELNRIVENGRQAFFDLATQAGMSEGAIEELWAQIGLAPDVVETEVKIDTRMAWTELGDLKVGIDSTTGLVTIDGNPVPVNTKLAEVKGAIDNGDGTVTINGNSYPADMSLETYLATVANSYEYVTVDGDKVKAETALTQVLTAIRNGKESVNIGGKDYAARDVLGALMVAVKSSQASVSIGASIAPSFYATLSSALSQISQKQANVRIGATPAAASFSLNADGGIRFFADGAERHVAQIARPGEWRVWAEPETGGEAYIPLAVSKRKRSLEILAEVARRFGYGLTQYSKGGLATAPVMSSGFGGARLVLEVDGREFPAYLRQVADARVAAHPGVRAAGDLVTNGARYRAQMGV